MEAARPAEVQSYQHTHAGSWLHIDPQGQFYDRRHSQITRENALEQSGAHIGSLNGR